MPYTVGGHLRETPEEAGLKIVDFAFGELCTVDAAGKLAVWRHSSDFAGAALVYNGELYEFCRSIPD